MMSCSLSLLILYLSLACCLSSPTVSKAKHWEALCPKSKCLTVDLSSQQKFTYSGLTNDYGIFDKPLCIKRVDPLSVSGLRHLWYRYHITLSPLSDKGITLIFGNSSDEVEKALRQTKSDGLWNKRVIGTKFGSSPYDVQCVGVRLMSGSHGGNNKFNMSFDRRLQIFFPVALALGLFLFYISPYLTRNIHFYYTSGVFLGIVASLLVLLYVFSKFVPKKNILGVGVLLGGYTFTGFLVHWIWNQGVTFVQDNLFYVICYVVISGMISFGILYRIGPAHVRTMTLVKWLLQLVGLGLMGFSMQFLPFGVALVTAMLLWNQLPSSVTNCIFNNLSFLKPLRRLFKKKFQSSVQRISMGDYKEQGIRETQKALDELRAYCWMKGDKWRRRTFRKLNEQDDFESFLRGDDDVPDIQRKVHEQQYNSDLDDSDTEESAGDLSYASSGIPSPNPTPPSAPSYPHHEPGPPNYASSPHSRHSNQYHTTYN